MIEQVFKVDTNRRTAGRVVYRSDAPGKDSQSDVVTLADLHIAAITFGVKPRPEIKLEHGDREISAGLIRVVQSFVTSKPSKFGGRQIPTGSWYMTVKVREGQEGDQILSDLASGKLNGYSLAGEAVREQMEEK